MGKPKSIVDEAKEAVKNKQKEEKKMNKSNTARTILTVVITLVSVAVLVGVFYLGTQFQDHINSSVVSQVKDIVATTPSKQ